jgi:hypothetical protein
VRYRIAVALFFVLFLLPMFYRAIVSPKPLPVYGRFLSDLQALSCLFSYKPNGWAFFYVQVRYAGDEHWTTVDQSELFPLEPFGHRTRLHRLLQAWDRKPGRGTEEVADWFFDRWATLHPDEPQPEQMRLAWSWTVPDPAQPPQGEWRTPDWNGLRADRRRVIAVYDRER